MSSAPVPYVLVAGQERSHPGTWPTIKAGVADTGGALTAVEDTLPPWASGPPLHLHDSTDECLYVAAGAAAGADRRGSAPPRSRVVRRGYPGAPAHLRQRRAGPGAHLRGGRARWHRGVLRGPERLPRIRARTPRCGRTIPTGGGLGRPLGPPDLGGPGAGWRFGGKPYATRGRAGLSGRLRGVSLKSHQPTEVTPTERKMMLSKSTLAGAAPCSPHRSS